MSDGGLEDAISAARAKRAETERIEAERRAQARPALIEAQQSVRAAGETFAQRARDAEIRPGPAFINGSHTTAWTTRQPLHHKKGRETVLLTPGIFVLVDGTIMIGDRTADAYLDARYAIAAGEAKTIVAALGAYLAARLPMPT